MGSLFVNPRSGDNRPSAEELRDEAARRGIDVRILESDDDPAEVARAVPEGPLGAAGGDGTLASIAEVAIERDLPFVCIPFGTRNHFARDLGLDRDDPIAALDAYSGSERRIDVGRVGDRLFLNNVSIGAYAELVHRRERHRRRRNAFAQLRALYLLVRNPGGERLTVDGEPVSARIAFVGNNDYNVDLFSLGERERLDEGLLHLYLASSWRPSTWEERKAERLEIDSAQHRVKAAVDGEPVVLETPLEFSIQPRALRVLVPGSPD